jgi:predicted RNA-binding protein with PIN domain
MEKAREALLSLLAGYRKGRPHDITVVFDGYRNGMAVEQHAIFNNVKVIYTHLGEKADDVIKKLISRERKDWIVVTEDRDIVDHAWAVGSVPVHPDRFMGIVEKSTRHRPSEEITEADDEDDEYGGHERKGNAYQPSKKEKAIRRVLAKL